MYVLAHLSDPHLGPMPRAHPFELVGKRALGFINWHRGRKKIHRADVLVGLVSDLKEQAPDHIAVTGDLVNIALPGEFHASREFLDALGPPQAVSAVPGNHDLYVRRIRDAAMAHWGEFMAGDGGEGFPYLRRRGPLALIGVSSAVPTAPFMATGMVGTRQLLALRHLLDRLRGEDLFRVIMIHHPPVTRKGDRFKRLIDRAAFRQLIAAHGADLVLHGHDHVHSIAYIDGPGGPVPVAGVPSASSLGGHGDPAAYNLYRIAKPDNVWRCEAVTRGLRRDRPGITELARRMIV